MGCAECANAPNLLAASWWSGASSMAAPRSNLRFPAAMLMRQGGEVRDRRHGSPGNKGRSRRRRRAMSADAELIRVLVVDDHPLVREGIARQIELEPDMTLVAE